MPWCVGPLGRDWPRGRVQWAHPRPKLIIGPLDIDTLDAHMSLVVYLFLLFYVSIFIRFLIFMLRLPFKFEDQHDILRIIDNFFYYYYLSIRSLVILNLKYILYTHFNNLLSKQPQDYKFT